MTKCSSDGNPTSNKSVVIINGENGLQNLLLDHREVYSQTVTPINKKRFVLKGQIWQILPCITASLFAVSFGLMLGWPSPTYLKLFSDDSPLPISFEVSPLIAGLLMIGNIVATPISSSQIFGPKYNILISLILITLGWILMWLSSNMFWLLGSRFLIGFGSGFAMGQVKIYIKNLCGEENTSTLLIKCLNFYVIFGVILSYSIGPFISFRSFSLLCVYFTSGSFFLCFFIPHTPLQLIRFNRFKEARRLIEVLRPTVQVDEEISKIAKLDSNDELTICDLLRQPELRTKTVILVVLTFLQQFCGIPATIVYGQFILIQLNCPNSEYFAIAYIVIFCIANFVSTFYLSALNKKYMLIFSGTTVFLVLLTHIILLFLEVADFWPYTSFILMCLFNICHTVGLGTVPFLVIPELFPKGAKTVVVQLQIMFFSLFAILVTKIFQVLFSAFCLYVPFCMFAASSLLSVLFVGIFIQNDAEKISASKLYSIANTVEC